VSLATMHARAVQSADDLAAVADQLNTRPRKTLKLANTRLAPQYTTSASNMNHPCCDHR
jgi:hypothetical protein